MKNVQAIDIDIIIVVFVVCTWKSLALKHTDKGPLPRTKSVIATSVASGSIFAGLVLVTNESNGSNGEGNGKG